MIRPRTCKTPPPACGSGSRPAGAAGSEATLAPRRSSAPPRASMEGHGKLHRPANLESKVLGDGLGFSPPPKQAASHPNVDEEVCSPARLTDINSSCSEASFNPARSTEICNNDPTALKSKLRLPRALLLKFCYQPGCFMSVIARLQAAVCVAAG